MEAAAAQLDVRWTGPSSRRGKVTDVILSIAEITEIERAYALGAPTLGRAAAGLLARWQMPLRDIETFLRLAFLSWYRQNEPAWLTGLEEELPTVEQLVEQFGGEAALNAEARFVLGWPIAYSVSLGDDVDRQPQAAREWVTQAAQLDPQSRVFREWRYWLRDTEETLGARTHIELELHARFAGRGALGSYIEHMLRARPPNGSWCRRPR
jgi:hypothetical protein